MNSWAWYLQGIGQGFCFGVSLGMAQDFSGDRKGTNNRSAHCVDADRQAYERVFEEIQQQLDRAKQRAAKHLEPALNSEMHRRPHATYHQKKELAKWVNGQLRELGLAIRCSKTSQPALLVANPGPHKAEGQFRLIAAFDDGSHRETMSHLKLWPLELIIDRTRKEGLAGERWTRRFPHQTETRGR